MVLTFGYIVVVINVANDTPLACIALVARLIRAREVRVPMNCDLACSMVECDWCLMQFNDMKGNNTGYMLLAICAERRHRLHGRLCRRLAFNGLLENPWMRRKIFGCDVTPLETSEIQSTSHYCDSDVARSVLFELESLFPFFMKG
jgi:hypothetical protein